MRVFTRTHITYNTPIWAVSDLQSSSPCALRALGNMDCKSDTALLGVYSYYIGPSFCVLGCDIAIAGSGYITSSDTKHMVYIQYIGPISILHNVHIYIYIY